MGRALPYGRSLSPLAAPAMEDVAGDQDCWVAELDDARECPEVSSTGAWGFGDGSRHQERGSVGAAVVFACPTLAINGAEDWSRVPVAQLTRRLPMPRRIGAKLASIYDAEVAALLHIMVTQPADEEAPAVTDSQNAVDLVARGQPRPLREVLRGRNIPLESRLRRRLAALAQPQLGEEESATEVALEQARLRSGAPPMGGRRLLKVRAHQGDKLLAEEIEARAEEMEPNAMMVIGNKWADLGANQARQTSEEEHTPDLYYAAGSPPYFYTWGGAMVVEGISDFLRSRGREVALEMWAARPIQGAVARALRAGELSGSTMQLGGFRTPAEQLVFPPEERPGKTGKPFYPDRVMWKLRNYLGGSWTAYLQAGGSPGGAEEENVGPRTAVDELCPLCMAARGDLRHVALTCQAEGMQEAREQLWDSVEEVMANAEVRHLRKHPKRWTGEVETGRGSRWPTLEMLGWLMPTDHENELAAQMAARQPAEIGYDLGYRCTLPPSLAKAVGGPRSPAARKLMITIAEGMGVLRYRYMKATAAYRRDLPHAAEADGEPEMTGSEAAEQVLPEENEDTPQDVLASPTLCHGAGCNKRVAATGEARGVAQREGVCWRWYYHNKQEAARETMQRALWPRPDTGAAQDLRRTWLAGPVDPKDILKDLVRSAGIKGATAYHVAPAMRKVGITVRKTNGRTTAPLAEQDWEKSCRCAEAEPAEGCAWMCGGCAGIIPRAAGAAGEEEQCGRCHQPGGALLWCAGCAQWWHAKPGGSCAGVQECYRERGGLCPEHGALFAHRTWSHRATARGQQEADGVAAGADALAVSQDYPGAVAQEVRGNVDPPPEGIEDRTGEDLGAPASRRAWMTTGQRQRSAREARVRREGPGAVPAGHPPGALAKQLPGALPKSRPTLGSAPPGALPKSAPAVAPPRGSQQGGPGGAGPAALPPGATAKSAVRPVGNQSQRPGGKEQPQPARRGRKRPRRDQAAADEEETEGEEAEAAEAAVSHTPAARGGSASSSEPSAPVAGPRMAQGRTRRGGHTTHPPQDSATR